MLLAEKFIRSLVDKYGRHTVYTDGGTWYDEACNIIGLKPICIHHFRRGLIERVIQYFKGELNLLMITIHAIVKEEIVIMVMFITG